MRTASTDATRQRIVRSTVDLAFARRDIEMTLEEIAATAGVSVKTVLRHFGSRDSVIEAGIELGSAEVAAERRDPGVDPATSIRLLVQHYEKWGRFSLAVVASELPGAQRVADAGRALHRAWAREVFAARLRALDVGVDEVVDQLVVVTDVSAWKLLRLDRGLTSVATTDRVHTMVEAVLSFAASTTRGTQ